MWPEPTTARPRCVIDRHLDGSAWSSLAEDVLDGLTRPFKEIPPKYFYDDRGAELFDRICELPEYYPTRSERAILEASADDIAALTGAAELVELGSGTAAKTRLLLSALHDAGSLRRYVPVDVTESLVRSTAKALMAEYPGLGVHGVIGDFEQHLGEVPNPVGSRLVAFLGGTIGNFTPGTRRRFLRSVSQLLADGDYLLLGTDLVKDHDVLVSAYDDSAGITAEFNRNVLRVINRGLDGDFQPDGFDHVALFDTRHEWIEMRLRAREAHTVSIGDLELTVQFAAGEEIRTEISAKFTRPRVQRDLAAAGMELCEWLTDPDELFALSLARRVQS
jgi:L-histidine N-alpha-methyltransferase